MGSLEKINFPNKEKLLRALEELRRAAEILRSMGFDVTDRLIKEEIMGRQTAFPIVSDGGDGIRADYKNGELTVWFTNGFEDWDNPRRVEVMNRIEKDLGWEKTRVVVKKKIE